MSKQDSELNYQNNKKNDDGYDEESDNDTEEYYVTDYRNNYPNLTKRTKSTTTESASNRIFLQKLKLDLKTGDLDNLKNFYSERAKTAAEARKRLNKNPLKNIM